MKTLLIILTAPFRLCFVSFSLFFVLLLFAFDPKGWERETPIRDAWDYVLGRIRF